MITDFPDHPMAPVDDGATAGELAALGGDPLIPAGMRRTNFPVVTKEDVFRMLLAVRTSPDKVVGDFAESYRRYVGARHAIPTASGTASLHLALVGAGVSARGRGDRTGVHVHRHRSGGGRRGRRTRLRRHRPVDVLHGPGRRGCRRDRADPGSYAGARARAPGRRHRAPCALCRHCLTLVEDASHAHSARYDGAVCGSLGDAAGQSLMADKNFPVGGEGGIAFFATGEAHARATEYLDKHGIDYGMSWVAAAFGAAQLQRLPYYDEIRARNAGELSAALLPTGLFRPPHVPAGSTHAFNMYRVRLDPGAVGLEDLPVHAVTAVVHELLVAEGVPAREWQNTPIPCHLPFRDRGGFGNGYPFSLNPAAVRDHVPQDFPATLAMLESTLVLCRELRSPVEHERLARYAAAFGKVAARPDAIRTLVADGDFPLPYARAARLG